MSKNLKVSSLSQIGAVGNIVDTDANRRRTSDENRSTQLVCTYLAYLRTGLFSVDQKKIES